jgi:hypothetical protein
MQNEAPTAFGVAPPHAELKRLEPLLGNWRAEIRRWKAFSARASRPKHGSGPFARRRLLPGSDL